MSNQAESPQNRNSFDERVEILAKELELAVKWQRPCILLVVYSSEYVREDVEAALGNYLYDMGQRTVHLRIKDRETGQIIPFLQEFKNPANAVFFIDGFRWGKSDAATVYSTLNLQREFFVERQIRTIFWLTENEIVELAHAAPDFWAYRYRVIEFVDSPKAEQLIKQTLDSAWQGPGEYAAPYEDTDARISLRESMLTDLPRGEEASSIRANLLLTLGVLNWRKGDFEKADAQIQEALQTATKIQDAWFEAECYNAMALIKSSTERYDEAIDAYKQAIQLAPDQIFAWNNLGNLCAKIGRNDEAMIAFRKALEGNYRDAIAWTGLASVHFKVGYIDDAIAAYRKAIQYMPSFAQPWCGLGDVYASSGRADEAMKAYHKAIDLSKQYVTPWIRLGALFTKQERYREAEKAYQRALALDSQSCVIWNELGMIHVKSEALDEAVEAFNKAIELDRGFGLAYSNLAFTHMQRGEYKRTVSLLLRSIDLIDKDADKAVAWNRLATVYRCLNDYDNALAAYQMADKLDPGISGINPEDLKNEAEAAQSDAAQAEPAEPEPAQAEAEEVALASGDQAATSEVPPEPQPEPEISGPKITEPPDWLFTAEGSGYAVSQGVEIGKTDPASTPGGSVLSAANSAVPATTESTDAAKLTDQGNACFNRGDFEGAIEAYNQAILKDETFGVPYSNLALTYLTRGQFAEAILLYQKSIELLSSDKEKAIAWNGLGNAYRCTNDYTNAVTAYQRAAELDPETGGIRDQADDFTSETQPDSGEAWNERGEVFFRVGSLDKAGEAFNKAIEMEPGSGLFHSNLAGTLAAQGKYEEAALLYNKSIEMLKDDKDKAAAWNRLGNVYRKLNDYTKAIEAYQKAVVLADEGVSLVTRARFSLLSNVTVEQ